METLREWKEFQLRTGYLTFERNLENIKRMVEGCQERMSDWGVEMAVKHFATEAGASGTIGAQYDRLVALANQLAILSEFVESLRLEQAEA